MIFRTHICLCRLLPCICCNMLRNAWWNLDPFMQHGCTRTSILIAGYVKELSTGDILKLQWWQLIGLVVKLVLKMGRHVYSCTWSKTKNSILKYTIAYYIALIGVPFTLCKKILVQCLCCRVLLLVIPNLCKKPFE